MTNILLISRAALLLSGVLALQGCAVAGAAGTVVGTGAKVAGTAVGVTAKTAGAAGRAVVPGD